MNFLTKLICFIVLNTIIYFVYCLIFRDSIKADLMTADMFIVFLFIKILDLDEQINKK